MPGFTDVCPTVRNTSGRALFIDRLGSLYISRNYDVLRSTDGGATWVPDCRIPRHGWKGWASSCTLAARVLRHNIQAFQVLDDGSRVAVARDGIYRAEPCDLEMRRVWRVERGSRPVNLAADGRRILFGEYGPKSLERQRVKLFGSEDGGQHIETIHEFGRNDIRHIHNIIVDPHADHYWVLAGDHGHRAGIALLAKDFRYFEWISRGSQMVRAVNVLVRPDCLIYGSDTEMERNYIIRMDRASWRLERLAPLEGSSLYAADFGPVAMITTCVEPSKVNLDRTCSIHASMDEIHWQPVVTLGKDSWHKQLFMFGLIVLPRVACAEPTYGMFSGQALSGHHDQVTVFRVPRETHPSVGR